MKKVIALVIITALLAALAGGCAAAQTTEAADGGLSIVTTVFAPYDLAKAVTGGDSIKMLISPGTESHTYEPTPADIIAIENCDVFIYIGGEEDQWVGEVLSSMDTENKTVVRLFDSIDAQKLAANDNDEHIWTSPKNALLMLDAIEAAVKAADAQNAETYDKNAADYRAQIESLDADMADAAASGTKEMLIIGDRFPFKYLAHDYGIKYDAAYPNCEASGEPSGTQIAQLIDEVKEYDIGYVFHIEYSSERIADTICDATGAQKLALNSAHTVSKEDIAAGDTYVSIMEQNAENIREALK